MSERRNRRIEEVLKEEFSKILYKKADVSPEFLVTLTKVEISPDAREAKVWISVMPEQRRQEVMAKLNQQLPFFQHLLVKAMKMKWVPTVALYEDKTEEKAEKIESIILKIK